MGAKTTRRLVFLAANPTCCFCGGIRPAEEPDHVPARAFFNRRHWPVGYEFPACRECNHRSAPDEQAVAMLARIREDAPDPKASAATVKLMGEVHRNHPGLFEEMRPSVRQLRNARERYGLEAPAGRSLADLPVLSVSGPLVNAAVREFSRKLFCALFYKHTGSILSPSGGIATRWFSNLQIDADEIDRSIASVIPFAPKLERNTQPLDEQFFYRWGVTDTKRMAAFLAFFRRSFAVLGVVTQEPETLPPLKHGELLRPFSYPEANNNP